MSSTRFRKQVCWSDAYILDSPVFGLGSLLEAHQIPPFGSRPQEVSTRSGVARPRVEQVENEETLTTRARLRELQTETDLEAARLVGEEREMEEAWCPLGMFHRRWRSAAADLLPLWLSLEEHEMALEALDRVIARCSDPLASESGEEQFPGWRARSVWALMDSILAAILRRNPPSSRPGDSAAEGKASPCQTDRKVYLLCGGRNETSP